MRKEGRFPGQRVQNSVLQYVCNSCGNNVCYTENNTCGKNVYLEVDLVGVI